MRSNNSLDFAMMIDSKVVTGQNGWYSADTIVLVPMIPIAMALIAHLYPA